MDIQSIFNIIFGIGTSIFGWFARELWSAVQDLKKDLSELREQIPKEYVAKEDFKNFTDAIFKKLDRIEDKLDDKADKQ